MIQSQNTPEYSKYMYLKGYSPYEILNSHRQANRKKEKDRKKKREESIFEKEMFRIIEDTTKDTVNSAIKDVFKNWG